MNLQEIFNKVATHLLTQNERAEEVHEFDKWAEYPEFSCCFHDKKGRSCAVGCLISDEDYHPRFEMVCLDGEGWEDSGWANFSSLPRMEQKFVQAIEITTGVKFNEDTYSLLLELQIVHDQKEVSQWKEELADCAKRHGLTMP